MNGETAVRESEEVEEAVSVIEGEETNNAQAQEPVGPKFPTMVKCTARGHDHVIPTERAYLPSFGAMARYFREEYRLTECDFLGFVICGPEGLERRKRGAVIYPLSVSRKCLPKFVEEHAVLVAAKKAEAERAKIEHQKLVMRYYMLRDACAGKVAQHPQLVTEAMERVNVLLEGGVVYRAAHELRDDLYHVMRGNGLTDLETNVPRYEKAAAVLAEIESMEFRKARVLANGNFNPYLPRGEGIASARGHETADERAARRARRESALAARKLEDAQLMDRLKSDGGKHSGDHGQQRSKKEGKKERK